MRSLIAALLVLGTMQGGCRSDESAEPGHASGTTSSRPDSAAFAVPAVALQGTTWRLAEVAGTAVIEGSAATLEFTEAGKVSGNGSCNRFFGSVTLEGQTITIGPQGTTRMACPDPIAAQENRYLKALGQAERFEQAGDGLFIHCKGMDTPLRFVRQ